MIQKRQVILDRQNSETLATRVQGVERGRRSDQTLNGFHKKVDSTTQMAMQSSVIFHFRLHPIPQMVNQIANISNPRRNPQDTMRY